MAIKETIIKKIAEVFWPWVKANIWPLVQEHLIQIAVAALTWLASKIKDYFSDNSKKRAEEANRNAQNAEQKASESKEGSNDYHVYKTEAEVWKKVAEQYVQDLEELKQKVADLKAESATKLHEEITDFVPEVKSSSNNPTLHIGDTSHQLPKL